MGIIFVVLAGLTLVYLDRNRNLPPLYSDFHKYCINQNKQPVVFQLEGGDVDERVIICE
jgi:hypothetical protein